MLFIYPLYTYDYCVRILCDSGQWCVMPTRQLRHVIYNTCNILWTPLLKHTYTPLVIRQSRKIHFKTNEFIIRYSFLNFHFIIQLELSFQSRIKHLSLKRFSDKIVHVRSSYKSYRKYKNYQHLHCKPIMYVTICVI